MKPEETNVAKVATYHLFDEEGYPEDGWLEHVFVAEHALPGFMEYLRAEGVKHDEPEIGLVTHSCVDPVDYVGRRLARMRDPVTRAEEHAEFRAYAEQRGSDGA